MSSPPPGVSEDDLLTLGGNLAALASRAALELDNILLDQEHALVAIPWLASEIEDSITSQSDQESPSIKYNLSKVMVINRAFDAAGTHPPLAKIDDVVSKAGDLAGVLKQIAQDPKSYKTARTTELERMRAFCLAFARSVLATHRSRKDSRRVGRNRR